MIGRDEEWSILEGLARDAAAGSSSSPHVADSELGRVRRCDEAGDLDAAYRHLAACDTCRARLVEPVTVRPRVAVAVRVAERHAEAVREAARAAGLVAVARGRLRFAVIAEPEAARDLTARLAAVPHEQGVSAPSLAIDAHANAKLELEAWQALAAGAPVVPANVVPLRARRRVVGGLMFAAAAVALAAGGGALSRREASIDVVQRSYAGMMGEGPAEGARGPSVAAEDRDVELSLAVPAAEDATLLVCDATGRLLAKARDFRRSSDGRMRLVVAPRTFAPHGGEAYGFVVVGGGPRAREGVRALDGAPPRTTTADEFEAALRHAAAGARVRRITIGGDLR